MCLYHFVSLPVIFFRGIQKSKCFASFFGMFFMMDIMGSHNPFHVAVFCLIVDLYSTMDNYVMEYKIKNAITRDAYPNIQSKMKLLAHGAKKN